MKMEKYYFVQIKNIVTADAIIKTEWFVLSENSKIKKNIIKDKDGKKIGYQANILPYKENSVITKNLLDVLEYNGGIFQILDIVKRKHLLKKQIDFFLFFTKRW